MNYLLASIIWSGLWFAFGLVVGYLISEARRPR